MVSEVVWAQVLSRAGRLVERPVRELRGERLEEYEAVWQPPRYQGRRAIATWWRPADRARHVGCAHLGALGAAVSLEADRDVVAFASWPMRLHWADDAGGYVPDFFVRLADGRARLLVCRPAGGSPQRWEAAAELLEAAGKQADWQVRVHEGTADPVVFSNLQRLSRWRHTRLADADTARVLRKVFAEPQPLAVGVRASGLPELPTVAKAHHLIWTRELLIDWSSPYMPHRSLVWAPEGVV
ncbi:TnsA-like heteromeric transposase endonuclease subunit [Streptomyces sp. NPDC020472]|uniref:TnsA-like heteromeric transposase endonuclease subunit n=1 Tax=Streptomyces sp. NPDC020472 TaxID=3365075 RepID=UPI00378D349F